MTRGHAVCFARDDVECLLHESAREGVDEEVSHGGRRAVLDDRPKRVGGRVREPGQTKVAQTACDHRAHNQTDRLKVSQRKGHIGGGLAEDGRLEGSQGMEIEYGMV